MVEPEGFEPSTLGLKVRCYYQLSYSSKISPAYDDTGNQSIVLDRAKPYSIRLLLKPVKILATPLTLAWRLVLYGLLRGPLVIPRTL